MTSPAKRLRNGDYSIGGNTYWGYSSTARKGMPTAFALDRWKKRSIVAGLAGKVASGVTVWAREVMAADEKERGRILDRLAEEALDANRDAADLGTAVHAAIEAVEMGAGLDSVPGHLRPWVAGYLEARAAHGWEVVRSEVTGVCATVGWPYAGSLDHLVRFPGLKGLVVADVKTGARVYGDSPQLAAYAHFTHWLEGEDDLVPAVGVNQEVGLILHVTEAGTTVRMADLPPAWAAWLAALDLRGWLEQESRTALSGPVTPTHARRVAWVAERVQAVLDLGRDHVAVQALVKVWPTECPPPTRSAEWTGAHVDAIAVICDDFEARLGSPFGGPDPLVRLAFRPEPPAEVAAPEEVAPLNERRLALPSDLMAELDAVVLSAGITPGQPATPEALATVLPVLEDGEAKAARRRDTLTARADGMGITVDALARVAGLDPARPTEGGMADVARLAGAHADGLLEVHNGTLTTASRMGNHLLVIHGTTDEVVRIATVVRPAPSDAWSFAGVLADPLLAVLTAAAGPAPKSSGNTTKSTTKSTNNKEKQTA